MAFFSNSKSYDPQLRRKRSTSTPRDRPSRQSTDDKPIDETSFHKRSSSVSASTHPSAMIQEPHDPTPPLPAPMAADIGFRPRRTAGTCNISPSSYDQSSTPIPFTKCTKCASPPPCPSLVIDVPGPRSVELESGHSSSSRATVNHAEKIRTSSGRTAPSSTSYPMHNSSSVKHRPVSPEDLYTGLISPSTPRVERQGTSLSQRIAAVLPLKLPHSPNRTRNSNTGPDALPTPVSSPQGERKAQLEPIPIPPASPPGRPHSRSRSATNSPTANTPESGPRSAKSATRFPVPMSSPDIGEAFGPRSPSASGKSTPSRDAAPSSKPGEKRASNVLRKRSIPSGSRRREPESAPASDSEKKTNTHRPRSRSVAFSSRWDSSGPRLGITQPLPAMPTTALDLTPAKEILVAYKESHQDSFSPDTPLRDSGKVMALGSEESNNIQSLTRQWSSSLKNGAKREGKVEKQDANEKSGTGVRGLKKKLSGKWSSKELGKRRDNPTRSVSDGAVEVSERMLARSTEANRSATILNDTQPSVSPTSSHSPGRGRRPYHDEGRVWEEDAGSWIGKYSRDNETEEKDMSNSRRLWKLVKRLSSGNLREKVSPSLELPPPVPPLPKDLSRNRDMSPSEAHDFYAGEIPTPRSAVPEIPGGISRFIAAVPSLSVPSSETDFRLGAKQTSVRRRRSQTDSGTCMPSTPLRMNSIRRSVTTGPPTQTRLTATTRSSSPSSETTKFFSRSRSSSSSSFGDGIAPPMPSVLPPQLSKHTPSSREPRSSRDGTSEDKVVVEYSAKASAPSPPRMSSETSSTIPLFEAHHPVNNFLSYRKRPSISPSQFPDHDPITLCIEQAKLTNPPPLPKRNPSRPGGHSVSIPTLLAQDSKPNVIDVQDLNQSTVADGDIRLLKRRLDSEQTPNISKLRPRSTSDGAIVPELERYVNTDKSVLTFREMTTTQRQLTEQEKNAKWEDLLQRSDKAGGTLHVGSPITGGLGLWSDRSSVALSMAPSEILDSAD